MIEALNFKAVPVLPPVSKDNGDFDGNAVYDTQGIGDGILFLIQCGSLAAAVGSTAETDPLKITECDTDDGEFTDITGAELAAAIAAGKDGKVYGIFVSLRKTHKRFMKVDPPHVGSGTGTSSWIAILALGFGPQIAPQTAADMGLEELVLA